MSDNKNQKDENIKNKVSQVDESSEVEDDFLQEELQELQAAEDQEKEDAKADFTPLLNKIKELENQLQEKDEIAKNSQINYLHLKADFDILQRQTQQKVDNAERDAEIKVVKELLPFVENLRKSLLNLTDDQKESSIWEGLRMMYDNFIKSLEKLHIKPIESVWLEPNPQFHEPVSMQPVDDKKIEVKNYPRISTRISLWK